MTDERTPAGDPRVDAFLASLAETPVPRDLAAAVAAGVRARPSRRPSVRLPLLTGTAGLLAVVALAMAAGWRPPIDVVPGPPAAATPTRVAPGHSPASSGPTRQADAFQFLRIAATGAGVSAEAAVGARVLHTLSEEDLGRVVLLRERRRVGDGTWLKVEWDPGADRGWFVWIPETVEAVAPAGVVVDVFERTSWLGCPDPSAPDPASLASLGLGTRLACFGGTPFALGPVVVDDAAEASGASGEPDWLAGPATATIDVFDGAGRRVEVAPLRIAPGMPVDVPRGRWVRLTGHLDDPAATGCTRGESPHEPAGDAADQELWCRQQLVITGWTDDAPASASPAPSASP